jgi:hypothetical protein
MAITKKRFWAGARRGLLMIFQDRVDVAAGRACELPTLPTRDLVGDEAGLHGWTGRRVGRGAYLLTGGPVTHNGGGRYA